MHALQSLLSPSREGLSSPSLTTFTALLDDRARSITSPIDRAIVAGALADRIGFAFAGGYQAALWQLVGQGRARVGSLLVTEAGGGKPSNIQTRLAPREDGQLVLSGEKRWATMGTVADTLLVVADDTSSQQPSGRKSLRVVAVPAKTPGVRLVEMPPTPFAPEIPHAIASFDDVLVEPTWLLTGDGYERYVKAFRTVEDIHVLAAINAHFTRLSLDHHLDLTRTSELLAALSAARSLASEPPRSPLTHLALDALLRQTRPLFAAIIADLAPRDGEVHARLSRDIALLDVASSVRALRTKAAIEQLASLM